MCDLSSSPVDFYVMDSNHLQADLYLKAARFLLKDTQ